NCRIFSRALTLALSKQTESGDRMAILGLLNDMRPTMLELDTNWSDLKRKYPKAGSEPVVSEDISAEEIKEVILKELLASENDIFKFEQDINNSSNLAGWRYIGSKHISIFEKTNLDEAADLIRKVMEAVSESEHAEKFTLFDPLEELF
ncbi:MAG: hypothetical protein ACFFDT_40755, partial [Candidatus Hodarchaeota archaeon]